MFEFECMSLRLEVCKIGRVEYNWKSLRPNPDLYNFCTCVIAFRNKHDRRQVSPGGAPSICCRQLCCVQLHILSSTLQAEYCIDDNWIYQKYYIDNDASLLQKIEDLHYNWIPYNWEWNHNIDNWCLKSNINKKN